MSALHQVIFIALAAAFIILFIDKVGLRGKVIEKCPIELISKMFECDFCISFWTSVILAVIIAIISNNVIAIAYPVFTTPIVRLLL